MNFIEALTALKAGKNISRDCKYDDAPRRWSNKFVKFIFEREDLFANDWIIEGEDEEEFKLAVDELENSKKIKSSAN